VTCSVFPAPGSRACIFLSYLRSQLSSQLSSIFCKLLSPQLWIISKMVSSSTKSVFYFLHLTQSCVKILAALGVNFSELEKTVLQFIGLFWKVLKQTVLQFIRLYSSSSQENSPSIYRTVLDTSQENSSPIYRTVMW
jgi:hypothetical protein